MMRRIKINLPCNFLIPECEEWRYGSQCLQSCQCKSSTTSSCNKTDGTCSCKDGWTGFDCSEDVDECTNNPCPSNSYCTNTAGSYQCLCNQRYKWNLGSQTCDGNTQLFHNENSTNTEQCD